MKLYHVSEFVTRPRFRMTPRVPVTCMSGENTDTKRICVAPTIAGCLKGKRGINPGEKIQVVYREYKTSERHVPTTVYMIDAEPIIPEGVPDAEHTGELWLTRPTTFDKVGSIHYRTRSDKIFWHWAVKL